MREVYALIHFATQATTFQSTCFNMATNRVADYSDSDKWLPVDTVCIVVPHRLCSIDRCHNSRCPTLRLRMSANRTQDNNSPDQCRQYHPDGYHTIQNDYNNR